VNQEAIIARVVEALVETGVPHMVAGSFASSFHGEPRMTRDADIVIDADEASARRVVTILGFKIDLIVKKARLFSAEELRRRRPGLLAGRSVDFATAEDTVLTKLEWARMGSSEPQYGDAVGVIRVQGDRLDWRYLERWAGELGVADLLERARRGDPFVG
jgi:hypothetical protein